MKILVYGLITGIFFGFFLRRGQVLRYEKQLGALRLMDMTIVKFMLSSILVAMIGVYLLQDLGLGKLSIKATVLGGNILGGLIFGLGWGLFGYCPGTAMGAVGEGRWGAVWGILGMLTGAALFAEAYPFLQKTILAWGNLGKITLPQLLGVNHWFVIPVMVLPLPEHRPCVSPYFDARYMNMHRARSRRGARPSRGGRTMAEYHRNPYNPSRYGHGRQTGEPRGSQRGSRYQTGSDQDRYETGREHRYVPDWDRETERRARFAGGHTYTAGGYAEEFGYRGDDDAYARFERMGWSEDARGDEYFGAGTHYGGGYGTAPGSRASGAGPHGSPGYAGQGAWSDTTPDWPTQSGGGRGTSGSYESPGRSGQRSQSGYARDYGQSYATQAHAARAGRLRP